MDETGKRYLKPTFFIMFIDVGKQILIYMIYLVLCFKRI